MCRIRICGLVALVVDAISLVDVSQLGEARSDWVQAVLGMLVDSRALSHAGLTKVP